MSVGPIDARLLLGVADEQIKEQLEEAKDDIEDVNLEREKALRSAASAIRTTVAITSSVITIVFGSVDQSLIILGEAVAQAFEATGAIIAAGALTPVAVLKLIAATGLLLQIVAINRKRQENASRLAATNTGINQWISASSSY